LRPCLPQRLLLLGGRVRVRRRPGMQRGFARNLRGWSVRLRRHHLPQGPAMPAGRYVRMKTLQ
jgi:hypothetical protein